MKLALWIGGLAFAIFIGVGIYRAGLNEVPPPRNDTSIVFHGGRVFGRRIATRSWTADYDKIVSTGDQSILEVDGIHGGTIYKHGKPYLHVRAAHMTVNTLTHDFTIAGPFVATTVDTNPRRTFSTTSAQWNDALQRLTLDRRVVVATAGEPPLSFASASFNVKSGDVEIHNVAGTFR